MSQNLSKKNNKDLVLDFCNYLKISKGLSINTISAYRTDLIEFFKFIDNEIINNDEIILIDMMMIDGCMFCGRGDE